MVSAAIRLIEPTARARGVTLQMDTIAPALRVRLDAAELQHALINLALNAIQACQPGGSVRITAGRNNAACGVEVCISDNGCGIDPENQPRIFEPFFSGRPGGTGLGLFLSLNFARRCGGDIRVTSVPGRGSTFSFVLPVLSATRSERAAA